MPSSPVIALLLASMVAPSHEGEEGCLEHRLERAEIHAARRAAERAPEEIDNRRGWDPQTGRDTRNYPPDRVVDHIHMRLELDIPDPGSPAFSAREQLTVLASTHSVSDLSLDGAGMTVHSVSVSGHETEFFSDDERIHLHFTPPLPVGERRVIEFQYDVAEPIDGIFFSPAAPENASYAAEIHTQGQSITNRHWFIGHDSPNERFTTEVIARVPSGFQVSSNGRLISNDDDGTHARWHYLQDKPHVMYLVSLVVGKFDRVTIPHDRVSMTVWAPLGRGHLVQGTYGRTGRMIDLFERRFGIPYPWDRYDQLLVKNFGAGGMENTSVTSLQPGALVEEAALEDGDMDGLIAHELAHQWTGDYLTCRDWAHIWLNEGFATYGEALWTEERFGRDHYLLDILGDFGVARRDRTSADAGMVSPIYDSPDETFRRGANPYPKGSSILHMLRAMLGEGAFWSGIRSYMKLHALNVVETHDLRRSLEMASGRELEWFFEQWCERPGSPDLLVKLDDDVSSRNVTIDVTQRQEIDSRTPSHRFDLPIHVRVGGRWSVITVPVRDRHVEHHAVLEGKGAPEMIVVDPELHVLCMLEVEKAPSLWLTEAEDGPTASSRSRAVSALQEKDVALHRVALARIARDPEELHQVRSRAVQALASFGSAAAKDLVLALADEGIPQARVRRSIMDALAGLNDSRTHERLLRAAAGETSPRCQARAADAIASLKVEGAADALLPLLDSPHDEVRMSAVEGLANLDDVRALDAALKYGAYGNPDRSRGTAIRAASKLAHHDRDRVIAWLLPMLSDPHRRPWRSAGSALAELKEEKAIEPLERIAASHPDPDRRSAATAWIEEIRGGEETGPPRRGGRSER